MRFRLMATYLGVPYQAGTRSRRDGRDAVLPRPAARGARLPGGRRALAQTGGRPDLDALWQSRPVGEYRGEPCLVLDDLGARLHIAYLGRDTTRAIQLGYWEIDREVFEVVVARQDVAGLTEERVDFPLAAAMFPPSGDAHEVAGPMSARIRCPLAQKAGAAPVPEAGREAAARARRRLAGNGPPAPTRPATGPGGAGRLPGWSRAGGRSAPGPGPTPDRGSMGPGPGPADPRRRTRSPDGRGTWEWGRTGPWSRTLDRAGERVPSPRPEE